MADSIQIRVDAEKVIQKLGRVPDDVGNQIEAYFRQVVLNLEDLVKGHILAEFTGPQLTQHPGRHPGTLRESITGGVTRDGDSFVGTVGPDIAHAPYARILEEGGVISAHAIYPYHGAWLAFPEASLRSAQSGSTGAGGITGTILAHQVLHPGARMIAHHYMLSALETFSKSFLNDLETVIATSISSER
jgi:hypothetical protein